MVFGYGKFCDWFFTQKKYLDSVNNKRAWNLAHENKEFDFVVLGNSRAYGVFDMNLLNEKLGLKGINLGAPGSSFVDNYLTLNLFLKNNNKVKEIFLQVDLYSLNSKLAFDEPFHKYHFIQYWHDPVVKRTIIDFSSDRESRFLNIFPEARYVKFNKYYSFKEVIRRYQSKDHKKSPFDKTLGGVTDFFLGLHGPIIDRVYTPSFTFAIDKKDSYYLENLIYLCKLNNIKVTAFRAAEYAPGKNLIINYHDAYKEIEHVLTQMEIPYLMLTSDMEKNPAYFYDRGHLSKAGLITFTQLFIDEIKKKYIKSN